MRGRRRCIWLSLALISVGKVWAIEWSSSTSSTSSPDTLAVANVGDLVTITIGAKERFSIDFEGDPANHFAVSYRQCSDIPAQKLQIQYAEKLHYVPFVGGCIYAENELAELGVNGCTFWQYNPSETYMTSGVTYEDSELLSPGRVRFENKGDANATVDVAMFSDVVPVPEGLVDHNVWIEDGFVKKDGILNTSVNVYFNNDNSYCELYSCVVSGYINEYVEGENGLSLCQVQETGELYVDNVAFNTWIPLTFELPEVGDYYITLILSAKAHRDSNITALQEYGLDQIVVFQTDTTLPDSSGRLYLMRMSAMALAVIVLVNTFLSGFT